jgi:hypothetical protein
LLGSLPIFSIRLRHGNFDLLNVIWLNFFRDALNPNRIAFHSGFTSTLLRFLLQFRRDRIGLGCRLWVSKNANTKFQKT